MTTDYTGLVAELRDEASFHENNGYQPPDIELYRRAADAIEQLLSALEQVTSQSNYPGGG